MFFSLLCEQTVLTISNDANIVPLYCARENKAIATEPSYKGRAQTSVSSPWKQPQRQTSSQQYRELATAASVQFSIELLRER